MKNRPIHSAWQGIFLALLAAAVLAGCRRDEPRPAETPETREVGEEIAATITLTNEAFGADEPIPEKYTADGANVSPPLRWSDLPEETEQVVLVMDDPDAPGDEPFVHWVIYGIPGDVGGLPEAVPNEPVVSEPVEAVQGLNGFGETGYGGPAPPEGHGVHHYHFKLYALDRSLELQPELTKQQLLESVQDHILARGELVGTYER